jgi:hypothetical protein
MFANDTGITSAAPISTAMFNNSNQGMARMFSGCTSLVQTPLMNSISSLYSDCCSAMFQGCTGLRDASNLNLPTTGLTSSCCAAMFQGCISLTATP